MNENANNKNKQRKIECIMVNPHRTISLDQAGRVLRSKQFALDKLHDRCAFYANGDVELLRENLLLHTSLRELAFFCATDRATAILTDAWPCVTSTLTRVDFYATFEGCMKIPTAAFATVVESDHCVELRVLSFVRSPRVFVCCIFFVW